MCLYPRLIQNPKYKKNKKNGGKIPPVKDKRTTLVPIGCGNCIECRKQEARQWQVRLQEDIIENKNATFLTLTFSNEKIKETIEKIELKYQNLNEKMPEGYDLDNTIATYAVRHFLERWRKEYTTSVRHWLITELGHKGTENIHIHGLIWTSENMETIAKIWQNGYIFPKNETERKRTYVNNRTINYITKYVTKRDEKHKTYKPIILTSPGIGQRYTKTGKTGDYNRNCYKDNEKTNETYRTNTGTKVNLPIYYRNKIYTEEQREKLWLQKLDKKERYVMGNKIDIRHGEQGYEAALKEAQEINTQLGYGGLITWEEKEYANQRRTIKIKERIGRVK